ncbi:hypothetical protein RB195_015895 [Necator americanus]
MKSFLLLLLLVSQVDGLDSFAGLCLYPFHFGIGKLQGLTCEVSYQIKTTYNMDAFDICESNSPFPVQDARPGYPTICTYEKYYHCKEDEITIGRLCFSVRGGNTAFSKDGCGKDYKLHAIEDRIELKWIVALLYHKSRDFLWVGNTDGALLKPIELPSKDGQGESRNIKHGGAPIKIVMSHGAMRFIRRGTAVYGNKKDLHPYLCSRPAQAYEKAIDELDNVCNLLGFQCEKAVDHSGALRPFVYLNHMYAVRGSKFNPLFGDLHDACSMFPNGYVASLDDFKDQNECFRVLSRRRPISLLVRVTVGRDSGNHLEADKCQRDPLFKAQRKTWYHADKRGTERVLDERDWEYRYPSNYCADLPRTTAAISLCYYVDIPTIARRPMICSYGNPPMVPVRDRDNICNEAAYFDKTQGRCKCIDPEADGKILEPEKYGNYPSGTVCLGCKSKHGNRSIVFILDGTGEVQQSGWNAQKQFIRTVVDRIKEIRVGVVVARPLSDVLFRMDNYERIKDKLRDFAHGHNFEYKHMTYTTIGYALFHARKMLEREKTMRKTIVIFNDGKRDHCYTDASPRICPYSTIKLLIKYSQKEQSKIIRDQGIKILLIAVGSRVQATGSNEYERALNIAGGVENIIPVNDFESLTLQVQMKILREFCTEVY